ncbi:MAG: hypothetical protein ACFFBJ_07045 [Promethearchaeota archaeon]
MEHFCDSYRNPEMHRRNRILILRVGENDMQFLLDPLGVAFLIGFVLSIVFIMVFQSSFASSKGISSVPTTYSVGALLAFIIGTTVIIGLETPIHSWIGLIGGYLLLSLSIIQSLFDIQKQKSVTMEHS